VLTALCLALLAQAPEAPVPFSWDVPGVVDMAPVGNQLEARGIPMQVQLVRSKWKLDELRRHYYERFRKAGFHIPKDQSPLPGLNLPRLTALDPEQLLSYTLILYAEADGTTTLLLGAADVSQRRLGAAPDTFAPVFPGASDVVASNVELARSVTFQVGATPEEVGHFYRETMGAAGYREVEPGVFSGPDGTVRLATRPGGKKLLVMLWVEAQSP
jgi:hypothetical protein